MSDKRQKGESVLDWVRRTSGDGPSLEQMAEARRVLRLAGDDYMAITCGACGHVAAAGAWVSRPIAGEFAPNELQCPGCQTAVRRVTVAGRAQLVPIQGRI